eukprot:scaffold2882_cov119-Alexandrium_tamarense.AAC.1
MNYPPGITWHGDRREGTLPQRRRFPGEQNRGKGLMGLPCWRSDDPTARTHPPTLMPWQYGSRGKDTGRDDNTPGRQREMNSRGRGRSVRRGGRHGWGRGGGYDAPGWRNTFSLSALTPSTGRYTGYFGGRGF